MRSMVIRHPADSETWFLPGGARDRGTGDRSARPRRRGSPSL